MAEKVAGLVYLYNFNVQFLKEGIKELFSDLFYHGFHGETRIKNGLINSELIRVLW